jgi:hypothetical protein
MSLILSSLLCSEFPARISRPIISDTARKILERPQTPEDQQDLQVRSGNDLIQSLK